MQITAKWDNNQTHVQSITITVEPGDDPDGHINGLIYRDRLEAFLRVYARPRDLGSPENPEEARLLLARFAFVAQVCDTRLLGLMLAARDHWRLGWGTIAASMDRSRSTVKDQITATRRQYADGGYWYALDGLQKTTPEEAHLAAQWAERARLRFDSDDQQ